MFCWAADDKDRGCPKPHPALVALLADHMAGGGAPRLGWEGFQTTGAGRGGGSLPSVGFIGRGIQKEGFFFRLGVPPQMEGAS